jgi:hypothetical protein
MKRIKKWFHPQVKSGWTHTMPLTKRRRIVLKAHNGDKLSAARGKQALANVTKRTNKPVHNAALADARYFFAQHRKEK